jgi:hypothetical protein
MLTNNKQRKIKRNLECLVILNMRQTPLFDPKLSNPAQAGGFAGSAYGAMQQAPQYYQQMVQNQYRAPLLQQKLSQQGAKTLSDQAAAHYAAAKQQHTLSLLHAQASNQNAAAANASASAGFHTQQAALTAAQKKLLPSEIRAKNIAAVSPYYKAGVEHPGAVHLPSTTKSLGAAAAAVGANPLMTGSTQPNSTASNQTGMNMVPWENPKLPLSQRQQSWINHIQQKYDAQFGTGAWAKTSIGRREDFANIEAKKRGYS